MTLSPVVDALITVFEEEKSSLADASSFAVSRTVSLLAGLYEKARNAVEFRAEHLIRRAAIERILKRRILLNGGSKNIAENLVVELLWARYIDSSQVYDQKVHQIQEIIDRYMTVKHLYFEGGRSSHGTSWDTIVGLASSEIEETIVSAKKRQALTNFFYQAIRPQIQVESVDEKTLNIITYIAVERAYAQADDALINCHILQMIQPEWFTSNASKVSDQYPILAQNLELIHASMQNRLVEAVFRFVRKHTPPFLLIRDFFLENGPKSRELIDNPLELEKKLSEIAHKRYQEIGAKIRRSVVRSVIYIFMTKMVFALALEGPFDMFISKRIEYIPLLINMIFPPILLYAVAGFLSVPGQDNTNRLIGHIKKVFYEFDDLKYEKDVFTVKTQERKPLLTAIFTLLYLITFVISFGFITYMLTHLHFNIASQIIFVFFVTLVSFFAYRIRQSAKEYEVVDRQGFLAPIFDFFFLPVLHVGHILSAEIAKLNVFIIIFDFILEAPLKVIFEVLEEWIRFIRTKKEEII